MRRNLNFDGFNKPRYFSIFLLSKGQIRDAQHIDFTRGHFEKQ